MSTKHESIRLENSTYNILMALGNEADFLYSTVDTYLEDARKDNRQHLVELWKRNEERYGKAFADVKRCFRKRGKRTKAESVVL